MKRYYPSYFFIVTTILLLGCSTKKDAFLNRNWHGLNTKYNVLYNGNEALAEGKKTLIENYKDDYWEILPVERLEVKEEVFLPGQTDKNPNFERAEEKAAKSVQKHGMNIQGEEKNPQTDESYLLLGKARYYDQRFVPAMEAFNYILYKDANANTAHQARIWREKTNIRLENEEVALKNLKRLLRLENLNNQDYADANAIMGQAYINQQYLDSAVQRLKIASSYTKNNEERGRYYYIIGQLYNRLGHKDSANYAFQKVIDLNRKVPREYMLNAYIEQIRNVDYKTQDRLALLEHLNELEENRENRPFLDKIYREKANFYKENDSVEARVHYLNKSLRTPSEDKNLKALNYEDLAVIAFDASQYKTAGAYYDSTLVNLKENTKKHRIISKKRENLKDVIKYETIAQRNDSILTLVNMPEAERLAYFTKFTDSLRALEEASREKEKLKALQKLAVSGVGAGLNTSFVSRETEGFYFYNQNIVTAGINEFRRIWGERPLEDNWKFSNRATVQDGASVVPENAVAQGTDNLFSPEYYIKTIPSEEKIIDSIAKDRNFAYYQLGLLYKDRFKEYTLAAGKLEALLKNNPEEKLKLPAKFNLYKIYELKGSPLAQSLKEDIIENYPQSRYAEILKNPEAVLTSEENSPEALYAAMYKDFQQQNFEKTIEQAETYLKLGLGEELVPKVEMLKASALGRLQGFESYKEALNYIALNYPDTPEGKEAAKTINETLTKLENRNFVIDTLATQSWKLVFPIAKNKPEVEEKLLKKINQSIEDLGYKYLSVSLDVYDRNTKFVVVHGLISYDRALGYAELLKINKDYLVKNENFVISASNYKTLQLHKNITDYLAQLNNPNLNN